MRSMHFLTLAFSLPVLALSSAVNAGAKDLDSLNKKASYSIGFNFISRMNTQGVELDLSAFTQGATDAAKDNKSALSPEEMTQVLKEFQQNMQAAQLEKQKAVAEINLKAGSTFLAENAKVEGVFTTESGLQYKVLKEGNGATPKLDDTVVTHYEGRLIDGRVFDSSYSRNQPATFPVKGVIKGWTEALQLMQVGAKWQLFIPANIAYGESQRGQLIQPNSTLIFDIELLEIKPAKK